MAELFIIRDGKPNAEVVIAEERPRMASLAALELQYYLQQITSARLPITTRPGDEHPVKIHVGVSAATKRLGVTADGLKYGAFRMVSGQNHLVLLGSDFDFVPPEAWPKHRPDQKRAEREWDKIVGDAAETAWGHPFHSGFKHFWNPRNFDDQMSERYGTENKAVWNPRNQKWARGVGPGYWSHDEGGTLNAVYEFLRTLGVRWYMTRPLGEVIPKHNSIALPSIDKTVRPDYALRSFFWYNYAGFSFDDVMWARRIGMNSGYEVLGNMGHAHGLTHVHRRRQMKEAHPEYYALVGGKRDTEHRGYGTACYSSGELAEEAAKYARFVFDRFKQPHVSLWPTDGFRKCGCESCKGKEPSDLVWNFVNRVAAELYKTHPDRLVSCGAYTPYVDPPKSIKKFSPNVAVFISNVGRPLLNDKERWDFYWARVDAWKKVLAPGRILRVENNRYSLWSGPEKPDPFPVFHARAMAKDLRALKGISLGECDEQSQWRMRWISPGVNHLNLYVQSQFFWDASQNIDALLEEYYTLFYGPVRDQMKAAIEFAESVYSSERKGVGGTLSTKTRSKRPTSPSNVTFPDRIKLVEMLRVARQKAGETVYGRRVQLMIDELQPLSELKEQYAKKLKAGDPRKNAPIAMARDAAKPGKAKTYSLREIQTGKEADVKTTFSATWDNDHLVFDIRCEEPDMKNLFVTEDVWSGDSVALLIETPSHAYYQIEANPDGKLFDADRKIRIRTTWKSQAEVRTERGADYWRVTFRLRIVDPVQGSQDPNHNIVGPKPTEKEPWYFNVGRARVRGEDRSAYTFSPTGTRTYHVLDKFAKLVVD